MQFQAKIEKLHMNPGEKIKIVCIHGFMNIEIMENGTIKKKMFNYLPQRLRTVNKK